MTSSLISIMRWRRHSGMSIVSKSSPVRTLQASRQMPQRGCQGVTAGGAMRIALVNNMPDSALIRTEAEFTALLHTAIGERKLKLDLYALASVPRAELGRLHVASHYRPIEDLWQSPPDALIVTGTEPKAANLRDERYWAELAMLIEWADACGVPTMFSCLAAHAAVLHLDGIGRTAMAGKCFGVFDHAVAREHPLAQGLASTAALPHTRWNTVAPEALLAAGYEILYRSDEVGAGIFTKQRQAGWLYFQAHPEYDASNLLREYRRDVRRFLRRGRATYPELPRGYFTEGETQLLVAFRQRAMAVMEPRALEAFPLVQGISPGREPWREAAVRVTQNWLRQTVAAQAQAPLDTSGAAD